MRTKREVLVTRQPPKKTPHRSDRELQETLIVKRATPEEIIEASHSGVFDALSDGWEFRGAIHPHEKVNGSAYMFLRHPELKGVAQANVPIEEIKNRLSEYLKQV